MSIPVRIFCLIAGDIYIAETALVLDPILPAAPPVPFPSLSMDPNTNVPPYMGFTLPTLNPSPLPDHHTPVPSAPIMSPTPGPSTTKDEEGDKLMARREKQRIRKAKQRANIRLKLQEKNDYVNMLAQKGRDRSERERERGRRRRRRRNRSRSRRT